MRLEFLDGTLAVSDPIRVHRRIKRQGSRLTDKAHVAVEIH